uniref:Uncharacterized protein n=1 Tax=Anguilla anguilla TaxID=7936 RepID=A0A0E9SI30_ANGAN
MRNKFLYVNSEP